MHKLDNERLEEFLMAILPEVRIVGRDKLGATRDAILVRDKDGDIFRITLEHVIDTRYNH